MDNLFFYASKIFWTFASPDHLLLLVLTLAIVRVLMARTVSSSLQRSSRKKLLALALSLLCLWAIALLPMGNWLLYPLEKRYSSIDLPQDATEVGVEFAGIVVLGGPVKLHASDYWQALELNATAERLLALIELKHRYPELPLIFTGGSGSIAEQGLREADFVQLQMRGLGLEQGIHYERESRNTYENAVYSKAMIGQLVGADQRPWLLVTTAFHMPRSMAVFQQQGLAVVPYPVDHWSMPPRFPYVHFDLSGNLADLKMAMREWTGLLAYRLTGKTTELLGDKSLIPPRATPNINSPTENPIVP